MHTQYDWIEHIGLKFVSMLSIDICVGIILVHNLLYFFFLGEVYVKLCNNLRPYSSVLFEEFPLSVKRREALSLGRVYWIACLRRCFFALSIKLTIRFKFGPP